MRKKKRRRKKTLTVNKEKEPAGRKTGKNGKGRPTWTDGHK